MPKFSIIIPVYNVEKYIKRCLDSVFNQTFNDYEVIVVNDGSLDNSMNIVNDYHVHCINSCHVGVSEARNIGVNSARGDYLLFLDSDDYWDFMLLEKINNVVDNSPDLVRFQVRNVFECDKKYDYYEKEFYGKSGVDAFSFIVQFHYIENVWCYAIRRKYYIDNKFEFKKGLVHEDFGLTPLMIIKASLVNCISYIGYNYFRRMGSIMTTSDYSFVLKKVNDFYLHYLFLMEEIDKVDVDCSLFKSFVANSLIMKICELKGSDYKEFKARLKKLKVFDNILDDTRSRRFKKVILELSPKLFYKCYNFFSVRG